MLSYFNTKVNNKNPPYGGSLRHLCCLR